MAETIYALASCFGKAGVAVFRISGPSSKKGIETLVGELPETRKTYLRELCDPVTKEILDQVVVFYHQGPHSFTGEDVVEIHSHGSIALIRTLLAILAKCDDFRMALPGEFARRAFYNNKIDLTQAEAIADLIDAESQVQLKQAIGQLQGNLRQLYNEWRQAIIEIQAFIEAFIDFSDEAIPSDLAEQATDKIAKLRELIKAHLSDGKRGQKLKQGLYVTIIGPPNVGKSSLLNYLAARDAAIVSPISGTTRDIVEVAVEIGGYPFIFADTAGLRETSDMIESEGIKRALARAKEADLNMIMAAEEPLADSYWQQLNASKHLLIINKCDDNKLPNWAANSAKGSYKISVKQKLGLEELEKALIAWAQENFSSQGNIVITQERYRQHLEACLDALSNFNLNKEIELAAEDLRYAASELGMITGFINIDTILDKVFSSFCIGK